MKAFVDGIDYIVLLSHDELCQLGKGRAMDSPLLARGEVSTGKELRIIFDPDATGLVSKRFIPENSGWDNLESVVLTISQKGLERIVRDGSGVCHCGDLGSDFLIQYDPAA